MSQIEIVVWTRLKLSNNRKWDLSQLKGFADEEINVNEELKLALGWVENIVGKGENAGN